MRASMALDGSIDWTVSKAGGTSSFALGDCVTRYYNSFMPLPLHENGTDPPLVSNKEMCTAVLIQNSYNVRNATI